MKLSDVCYSVLCKHHGVKLWKPNWEAPLRSCMVALTLRGHIFSVQFTFSWIRTEWSITNYLRNFISSLWIYKWITSWLGLIERKRQIGSFEVLYGCQNRERSDTFSKFNLQTFEFGWRDMLDMWKKHNHMFWYPFKISIW